MKRLDELGVSPTPWKVDVIGDPEYPVVKCGDGLVLQHCSGVWCLKDARLIAAAPSLYEALTAMLSCAEKNAPYLDMSHMEIAMDMARNAIRQA